MFPLLILCAVTLFAILQTFSSSIATGQDVQEFTKIRDVQQAIKIQSNLFQYYFNLQHASYYAGTTDLPTFELKLLD